MKTPIYDMVARYAESKVVRAHMPGHKGKGDIEKLDITEITGADSLYEANGIIAESEGYAGELFGADTFYSTEGSSLCIRAMMALCAKYSGEERPLILAGRNAHKTFLSAVALLDLDVEWLMPKSTDGYLSCSVSAQDVERAIEDSERPVTAVYLTSPDYLGNICDIEGIAKACHKRGVILAVDNAHGAYLKFLDISRHPIDLGADVCCDSAHKTLRAITGAAYLHVSKKAPNFFAENVKGAMALFGSTSPSYLILRSLDRLNPYLAESYRSELSDCVKRISAMKERLTWDGYTLMGSEPLKLSVCAKEYGYTGTVLASMLEDNGIFCEFCDGDNLVLMLSPDNGEEDIQKIERVLLSIPKKERIVSDRPQYTSPKKAMSIREAMLSRSETLPVEMCLGRILASPTVSCPPAVPILVSGEVIDEEALKRFEYYGIDKCSVVI